MKKWSEKTEKYLLAASAIVFAVGVVLEIFAPVEWLACVFYIAAASIGLLYVSPAVVKSAKKLTADMNTLMGIAVFGALIMGFYKIAVGELDVELFRDAAIVIFLYQIGERLEDWSLEKTQGSIKSLMKLAPERAHVVKGSVVASSAANYDALPLADEDLKEVAVGSVVKILPGERVPLDGLIVEGESAFNEAPVTGESIPQDRGAGEFVYGGTLNTIAPVFVRVDAAYNGGMLSRIIEMVQGAQKQKAPYESFINRFAAVYTPIIVIVALVVGFGIPAGLSLIGTFGAPEVAESLANFAGPTAGIAASPTSNIWFVWIARALTLLVISCPCALVISTPVSFVSAITRAARLGVLVKGGAAFDTARHVKIVAFDKTGTLTKGEPQVVAVHPFARAVTTHEPPRYPKADLSKDQVAALAAALEKNSTHPLAKAVVAFSKTSDLTFALTDFAEKPGNGVTANLSGEPVAIGKPDFIREQLGLTALPDAVQKEIVAITQKGATCLLVSQGAVIVGALGISDTIRETTKEALATLKNNLHMKTVMLTGDNKQAASAVAKTIGVTDEKAELLPQDKVAYIEKLKGEGTVAFVGDGINDAPALATANLGITMGAAASDSALEVATVALLGGDLEQLPPFFRLAKQTMAVVKENIAFALIIKISILVLAMLGMVGMGWAIFADTGVTLIVVLNGMRLMLPFHARF